MSRGTAFYRKTAVELVRRYPEVLEALRDGRLCITAVHALSKAITPDNRAEVLPRFFHVSKQQAKALAAEIAPAIEVPRKEVVSTVRLAPPTIDLAHAGQPVGAWSAAPSPQSQSIAPPPRPSPPAVQPLTPTETRLHITVSPEFLRMLDACKNALSHAMPGASVEDVLAAGMKLILERDAKKKALVQKPRAAAAKASADRDESSRRVPAAIRREVWRRDAGRCQWPLASGGICGSEFQPELDHVVPFGLGGPTTADNLRVLCGPHNELAARLAYGDEWMERWRGGPRRGSPTSGPALV
jgi:hypothetical protein